MSFHVYSDYSGRETINSGGYAFVVLSYIGGVPKVHAVNAKRTALVPSTLGELLGYIAALRTIPDDSVVVVHTDVDHIDTILQGKSKLAAGSQLQQYQQELERLDKVYWRYAARSDRSDIYKICHRFSRKRAVPSLSVMDEFKQELEESLPS